MRKLRSENEIIQSWKGRLKKPLVSILCTAYNHEKFIEDALEGFLIQKTDFSFEILIHDDASTDKTGDIIKQYVDKYPNLIKPIYQTENQYSKGNKPGKINKERANGEYIAFCEGDDYWTDPNKLQIQVDFLRKNLDYVISGHDACVIDAGGNKIEDSELAGKHKKDFSKEDLMLCKARILSLSRVYRNMLKDRPPEANNVLHGDLFFLTLIGQYGKAKFHHEIKPASYRRHSGGVWSMINHDDKIDHIINTNYWIYRYYKRIGNKKSANAYWQRFTKDVCSGASTTVLFREIFFRFFFIRKILPKIRFITKRFGITN